MMKKEVSLDFLHKIDAYWRAANYLSVGQIYLYDNPLLKKPLQLEHIKPRLLGHFGTTPGLNFIYAHLNRAILEKELEMIYIAGPGHGGPGIVANVYLEGTYSEYYPEISEDEEGMRKLFKQFSFPGGIPSHVSPQTPGSIHEGGELGYSLAHAYGAVFDHPDLIAVCVVGDGEAETGALATSWHSNKFLNPICDGAVLPILHLNGYKISEPTILARISQKELESLFYGYGYQPYFVEGTDPIEMHQKMISTLDIVLDEIQAIQSKARKEGFKERPFWPMIILRTLKGWSCPKEVDGLAIEGSFRSHQVPVTGFEKNEEHIKILESWMKSYRPEELFDEKGKLVSSLKELVPKKEKRMGRSDYANGGILLKELHLPDFQKYAIEVELPGKIVDQATQRLGLFLKDLMQLNAQENHFRLFGPDETLSNRLGAVFEVTERVFTGKILKTDEHIAKEGRVMEVLSEHLCQGWLEGYLLSGRHGFFSCYEAFIHIIDSMFNQHAKWLKICKEIPWRKPIASLNYLLTSHVWRQDHNGFSHQDPGFIDHVVNKKASIIRTYFPPDSNSLLSVANHCLKSKNYINVIVAGKQPSLQWLDMQSALKFCEKGLGIWQFASNDFGQDPDVVMVSCGDVPTLEVLAAIQMLRQFFKDLKIRMINVIDLMVLQPNSEHPHGLKDDEYDLLFTIDKPIIFAFHGYPWLIHRLTYRRKNQQLHVRGYKEEGTTTTPFDMCVLNEIDRFHLVMDVIHRVESLREKGNEVRKFLEEKLLEHKKYIQRFGEDLPEIRNWKWE